MLSDTTGYSFKSKVTTVQGLNTRRVTPDENSSHCAFKLKLDMYKDTTAQVLDHSSKHSVLKTFTGVVYSYCVYVVEHQDYVFHMIPTGMYVAT